MSHISANNIDRKLIRLSMSLFSGSRNAHMTIRPILVCGGAVVAIFKMSDMNLQCPISRRII